MKQDEVRFLPDHRGVSVRHLALIAAGFFLVVQLLFLEEATARLAFTAVFAVFLLLGLWLSNQHARHWPQEIIIDRTGLRSGNL